MRRIQRALLGVAAINDKRAVIRPLMPGEACAKPGQAVNRDMIIQRRVQAGDTLTTSRDKRIGQRNAVVGDAANLLI